jgi:hypothetical protein
MKFYAANLAKTPPPQKTPCGFVEWACRGATFRVFQTTFISTSRNADAPVPGA